MIKSSHFSTGNGRAFSKKLFQIILFLCVLSCLVLTMPPEAAHSQDYVEFPEIWSSDVGDFDLCQAKITYMGVQSKIVKTLAFSAVTYPLDMGLFVPHQYPDANYSNDSHIITLELTATELKAFADQILAHPELHPLGYVPDAAGAVAIIRGNPGTEIAWEHMCSESELRTVFSILYSSIDPTETSDLEKVLSRKRNFVGP